MASLSPDRSRAAGALLAFGLACGGLAALLGWLAIGTAAGQRLDDAGRGGVSTWDEPDVYRATSRLLDTISVASLAVLGAGIVLLALMRRRPRLAVAAGVILVGANVTTQVLKGAFDRPDLVYGWWTEPGAFPSGHATVAMSLAMALTVVVPPSLRWTAALGGCAYAAGVGVAVLALDWHRPSEVIGAYLVVAAWTGLVMALVTATGPDQSRDVSRLDRAGALAAAGVAGLCAVAVAIAAARRLEVRDLVQDHTSLVAAAAVCAAACAAVGALATALIQRASLSRAQPSAASLPGDARRHPHRRG